MKPLTMDALMDLEVQTLSGGELQRVAIVLALGKPADVSIPFLMIIFFEKLIIFFLKS